MRVQRGLINFNSNSNLTTRILASSRISQFHACLWELRLLALYAGHHCVIRLTCLYCFYFRSAIGVGVALLSFDQMIANGMRGKGFRMLHLYGDRLW